MTDPTAADVLNAWLARHDANDKAAAHGRPIKWDADGNVTATSHNFDNVIPPMGWDEVAALRALLNGDEDYERLDACERCGGDPCSECGECPAQGCWDCRCGQQDYENDAATSTR